MTARHSLIRRLIAWMVLANALVVIGAAGMYLWRGYGTRGNEVADQMEHAAEMLAQGAERSGAGSAHVITPPSIGRMEASAAVINLDDGRAVAGSDMVLAETLAPIMRQGLTDGTLTLEIAGHERLTVVVVTEGRHAGIVGHRGEMAPHLLDWVLHELISDILPIFLPLFISTVAVAAVIIAHGLRPLRTAAAQAAALSLEALDLRLSDRGLSREMAPLIEALNSALDRVEAAFLSQRRFTANAAHELRTPLAVLKARCDGLGETPLREALMRDIDRMSTIIEQLLAMARIESGQVALDEMVDVTAVAVSTIADLYPLAHAQGRDIAFESTVKAAGLRGNATLFHGALRNVIENALRLSPEGGTVEVRLEAGPRLSVLDRGPGVPPDLRQAIFAAFFRGTGSRGGGAGLGLAIASEATRLHGGRLAVDARDGGGACFTFDFSGAGSA